MKKLILNNYILPSFYASALINNDYSGLEDNGIAELNEWLERVKPGYCVGCVDIGFKWENEINKLGADCSVFTFQVREEK